jgi:hypothetical protein
MTVVVSEVLDVTRKKRTALYGDAPIVATGSNILPSGYGGLFRVDPKRHGHWSVIHSGCHTIQRLVAVNWHLMAFARNKLYEIEIDW